MAKATRAKLQNGKRKVRTGPIISAWPWHLSETRVSLGQSRLDLSARPLSSDWFTPRQGRAGWMRGVHLSSDLGCFQYRISA